MMRHGVAKSQGDIFRARELECIESKHTLSKQPYNIHQTINGHTFMYFMLSIRIAYTTEQQ